MSSSAIHRYSVVTASITALRPAPIPESNGNLSTLTNGSSEAYGTWLSSAMMTGPA